MVYCRRTLPHGLPSCENADLVPFLSNATMSQGSPNKKWMCVVCGFIYDEAEGLPEEGIEPGTRWEDVPDTWTCPDCGATKADFEMVEVD